MKLLRRILLLVAAMMILCPAEGYSYKVDDQGFIFDCIDWDFGGRVLCIGVTSDGPQSGVLNIPQHSSPYNSIVDGIGEDAFKGSHGYTELNIPAVEYIFSNAFSNCTGLTSVNIDNGWHRDLIIWDGAFSGCTNLTDINFYNTEFAFGRSIEIGRNVFRGCTALTSIELASNITKIGDGAFGETSIASLEIPGNVKEVSGFNNCDLLTSVTFTGDRKTGILGVNAFKGCRSLTSISIHDGFSQILDSAFSDCTSLATVKMPYKMRRIGSGAFSNCTSLESIEFEGINTMGANAFSGCTSLKSANLLGYLSELDMGVFSGCTSLTSVEICEHVERIYNNAFSGCTSLASITLPRYLEYIYGAFKGCTSLESIVIPGKVTGIYSGAFSDCTSLTSVDFPYSLVGLGERVFSGCTSLTSIDIPGDVEIIRSYAFSGCTSMTSAKLPRGLKLIYDGAFSGNSSLTSIVIPDGVTEIGDKAFSDCTSLASITLPGALTSLGKGAFCGNSGMTTLVISEGITEIGDSTFMDCSSLTSITFPKSLTTIGEGVFSGSSSLTSIVIPEGVKYIWPNAFSNCASLTSVTLPSTLKWVGAGAFTGCPNLACITIAEGTKEIPADAFSNCTSLTSVEFPASVSKIGGGAFSGCHGLTTVSIPETVKTIGYGAFNDCQNLKTLNIENSATPLTFGTGNDADPAAPFAGSPLETLYMGRNMEWTVPQDNAYTPFGTQTSLRTVTFGPDADRIKENTFAGCTSLGENLTIPGTVKYIGALAFDGCSGIKNLSFERGEAALELAFDSAERGCFRGCLVDSIYLDRHISFGADSQAAGFPICEPTNLKAVLFGENVTEIPASAFSGCSALTSIGFGSNLITINSCSFAGCTSLGENLTIPGTMRYIGASAFDGCTGIKSLSFESGENDLELAFGSAEGGCFKGCPVDSIFLDRNISSGTDSQPAGFPICDPANMKTVIFGENITEVPASAFSGCTGLESIDLVPNLTTIETSAFSGCTGLKSLNFGANLTTIGSLAFSGCTGLSCIVIPPTIDSVGTDAFKGCTGLLKSAYPDKFQKPISNGYAIAYPSESYLFTDDGCIYNTDKTMLYFVPMNAGRTFELEGSVKYLNGPAFYGCYGIEELVVKEGAEDLVFDSPGVSLPYTIESLYMGRNIQTTDCPFDKSIREVTISDNVTTIGQKLFYACPISSIVIPENTRKIGRRAFAGSDLKKITIPNSVESIGDGAFEGCASLAEVRLPENLTEIANDMFYGCIKLENVAIPETVTRIGNDAFSMRSKSRPGSGELGPNTVLKNIQLPRNLKEIGDWAFSCCHGLTAVSIPEGLISIGDGAFYNCALTKVSIPGSVSKIATRAFSFNIVPLDVIFEDGEAPLLLGEGDEKYDYYLDLTVFYSSDVRSVYISRPLKDRVTFTEHQSLISATLTDRVLTVHSAMFFDCKNLTSVTLSKGLKTIDNSAFAGCSALEEILIPESVTRIDIYAFANCTSLKSIEIPNGIEILASSVFSGCKALKNVSLPASLTAISSSAFMNCDSLSNLNIPSGVRTIGNNAFEKTGLTEIRLPGKMEKIGASAFAGCKNLTKVYSLNPVPPLIESSTFDETTEANATLMVPEDARMYYAVDHIWREFKNISGYSNIMEALPEATYGDGDINLDDYAPDGFRFVYTADNDDVVTIQGSMMRITGAGETTITATTADGSDSGVTGLVRRFVVNKACLTVSVNDMTIMEGEELPPFEYTAEGFVNDDTIDDIEQMPTPECAYTVTSPAGVYPVRLVGGRDRNYSFITEDAELTVTENVGIDSIEADRLSGTVEVYNLNGVLLYHGPLGEARLQQGIYMVRRGNVTSKLYVK